MYAFEYHRAANVQDASEMLASFPDAKLLAGGMSLVPMLKLRFVQSSHIIDLCELRDLCGISCGPDKVTIGAMTTHAVVAASPELRTALPALAMLAGGIGDPHCRNRGTIGGSLAHNDPAADYPSAALALNAQIQTNRRTISADQFFISTFETALEEGELITAVHFPVPARAAYVKFAQPASRFALVGVFVAETQNGPRVAVTGSAAKVLRVPEMERKLSENFHPGAIGSVSIPQDDLNSDIYADPEYRAHLIKVLASRAVAACVPQAA